MSCISSAEKAAIRAAISTKQAQLAIANTTYSALLAQQVEEYRFDSNEGSQRATRRKLEAFQKQIDWLQAEIDNLIRRLNSTGLVSVNLRRKFGGGGRFR